MSDEKTLWKGTEVTKEFTKSVLGKAAEYLVLLLLGGLVTLGLSLWLFTEEYLGAKALNFASNVLTSSPDTKDAGKSYYQDAVIRFQKSLISFAQNLMVADPDFIDRANNQRRDEGISRSMRDFQQTVLQKFTDVFTVSPDSSATQYPTGNQRLVQRFKDSIYKMIANNRNIIGSIQTGAFNLTSNSPAASTYKAQLFVDRQSSISLELNVKNLDDDQDNLSLVLGLNNTCRLTDGWNTIKVDVVDLESEQLQLHGHCATNQVKWHCTFRPHLRVQTPRHQHCISQIYWVSKCK